MGKGRKPAALVAVRQEEVLRLMVKGMPTKEICVIIADKYGVGRAAIEKDITAAYKYLKENIERKIGDVVSVHVMRYEKIYDEAMQIGDFRSAIAALKEIEALLKVRENQPLVANNTLHVHLDGLSTEQIKSLLYGKE